MECVGGGGVSRGRWSEWGKWSVVGPLEGCRYAVLKFGRAVSTKIAREDESVKFKRKK